MLDKRVLNAAQMELSPEPGLFQQKGEMFANAAPLDSLFQKEHMLAQSGLLHSVLVNGDNPVQLYQFYREPPLLQMFRTLCRQR